MHDFSCTDAKDMKYKILADRVRYFKEDEKGVATMCKAMEEWAEELREEGEQLGMKNTLKLVAKMSENGDTEYIARLLEPEVFEQMAEKYGMKA